MEDEIWEYYREEAMDWAAKRDQAFRSSQQAYNRGDGLKAKSDSNYGKFCGRKCEEANKSAANAIFIQMNENRPLTEIDLHGLFVKEAIERLEDRVIYALESGRIQRLDVIVGQGHHSDGGAKLKPSVMQFAKENGIPYALYKHNPGCIQFQFRQLLPSSSAARMPDVQNKRDASNGYRRERADDLFGSIDFVPETGRFVEQSSRMSRWWIIAFIVFYILVLWLVDLFSSK